ncbi:hypothetical protein [Bacteroides sp. 224]|uniref:hypothetical protein n=1 Tax=Bacteroides sp. 224 TaxID=2302936 RepID=UPI0013D87125|nr:hypothetical protein [Bacteroides sp. 224]NDV64481.1 hypothetical protein [Bacteroides sp. 224]
MIWYWLNTRQTPTEKSPLPAVALGEVDLEIRYGVQDALAQCEQTEINYVEFRKLSKSMAFRLAEVVIGRVASSILTSLQDNPYIDRALPTQLAKETELFSKYCSFLSKKFHRSIKNDFTNLMKEDGMLDGTKLTKNIMQISENEFLNHKEITPFFAGEYTVNIKENAKKEVQAALTEIIPGLIKDSNFLRKRLLPSMDVVIAADELAKLPEECIHTFKLKISPREIPFYTEEDEHDE